MADGQIAAPGAAFKENHVDADGFNIRYMEAGSGDVVVYVHGAGGLRLSGTHDLLAEKYRVIAVEVPGFGDSPENTQSETLQQLAGSLCQAIAALGIKKYNLVGNSFGGKAVLWMALEAGDAVDAVALIAPAAIREDTPPPPFDDAAAMKALLFAHPDKQPEMPPPSPAVGQKQTALVMRLIGPPRDAEFEAKLAELELPVLALFGTKDRVIPHEWGHYYVEAMPQCRLVMVYDAAHAIDADRPEAVTAVVDDFFQRHEQFLVKADSEVIHP